MSTSTLNVLIRQASTELGSDACRARRHTWASEGGRPCPHDLTDNCSQAVYRCSVCGAWDYGEVGGPGDTDCASTCQHRWCREQAIQAKRPDPLNLWLRESLTFSARQYHHTVMRALRRQPKPRLP